MRSIKLAGLSISALLLCAVFAPHARADQWNEKTVVTVTVPIEIPGKALPAGTYVFMLANSQADRHIVQIWNADQTHLIATIKALPDYRSNAPKETVLHFAERPINCPMALDEWFYPGDKAGQEFFYPAGG